MKFEKTGGLIYVSLYLNSHKARFYGWGKTREEAAIELAKGLEDLLANCYDTLEKLDKRTRQEHALIYKALRSR